MTFQERILRRFHKGNDFRYLDDLVNSGKDEVKLTSDICLSGSDELLYAGGIEIKNDLIIDGDGHTIDAKEKVRIFKIENKKVTFKNINFKNGSFQSENNYKLDFFELLAGGGAVYAFESNLTFENCSFENCHAHRGGAISISYCETSIDNCYFTLNIAKEWAGAIFDDDDSSLTITNSTFKYNAAGKEANDIVAIESSLIVSDCNFFEGLLKPSVVGRSSGNVVLKDSTFNNVGVVLNSMSVIKNCTFKNSEISGHFSNIYIPEGEDYDINIEEDKICHLTGDMDWVRELTEHELAGEFLKYFPKFNDMEFSMQDRLHDEMMEFVEIWREICSYDSNFIMADVIVNLWDLNLDDIDFERISKDGAVDKSSFNELHDIMESVLDLDDEFNVKNFTYLEDAIHSGGNVSLNSNILIDDEEILHYRDGIKIDVDDLTIDGNNHSIDADNSASIFKIDGKNVTIKNLVFKNAISQMGGAILNIGDVKFENCKFIDNTAFELGGAIVNDEKMLIKDCEFVNNSSGGVGGAIAATFASVLEIKESKFIKNEASLDSSFHDEIIPVDAHGFGGAIYNNGKLDISNTEFSENSSKRNGGAMIILPDSKINIESSLFRNNHAEGDGGAIHTMGDINIRDSEFTGNSADNNAGVFDATESSKIKISNSKFENNTAKKGNVVVNKGKLELIETEIREDDIADESSDVSGTQHALPGDDESVEEESGEDSSNQEFPEGYDDYARKFKDYLEEMMDGDESAGSGLKLSLLFALWASKFPEDSNLIAAAILMAKIYDDELVRKVLDDFSQDEYIKKLSEYDPIDEELSLWFLTIALMGMVFHNSDDD